MLTAAAQNINRVIPCAYALVQYVCSALLMWWKFSGIGIKFHVIPKKQCF